MLKSQELELRINDLYKKIDCVKEDIKALELVSGTIEERISLNDVDFIGTQNGIQNQLDFEFSVGDLPITITSWIINGVEKITNPILIYTEQGLYVYEGQLAEIWNTFAIANNITDSIIDDDIENNGGVYISNIIGLNINSTLTEVEGETTYDLESESLINTIPFPADINNPTTEEVKEWVDANLTQVIRDNGTQLTYYVDGDGGSNESPDFVWTLNDNELTLSNKRVFNSKTVYVDAGSGSDVTGKRGYREFPFKTLNAALVTLENGDTLYVFPGDYYSSVTVTKYFNIYCENGVNWDLRARFNPYSGINNASTRLNWHFDNLYGTALYPAFIGGINYVNISFNNYEHTKGLAPGFSDMCVNIKRFKNAYFYINSTLATDTTNNICNLNIENMIINQVLQINTPISVEIREKTKVNININNAYIIGDLGGDNGLVNLGSNANTEKYKDVNIYIENCSFYPTSVYGTTPLPFDNRNAWRNAWLLGSGNGILWVRQAWTNGSNFNLEIKNYRGTGWGAYINLWNYDVPATSPTEQRIINVKIHGYWEKSAPVSIGGWGDLTGVNQPLNTTVHLELDVICDEAPGVMFFWYGSHPSNRFIISGRIVTKYAGMPCITLNNAYNVQTPTNGNFNSNGTILLKDLIMINDGTVAPIAINPLNAQVQEVKIMNVKSNSLIVDANITEIGESIVRNINYK